MRGVWRGWVGPNSAVHGFNLIYCCFLHKKKTTANTDEGLNIVLQAEEEKKKKVIRLPVQRSVETGLAVEFKSRFTRQPSRDPDAEDPKPGA